MWDAADRAWLRRQLDERLGAAFGSSTATLFEATGGEVGAWLMLECDVYRPRSRQHI